MHLLISLISVVLFSTGPMLAAPPPAAGDTLVVASVAEAHTLHLSNGERVRLIGVDVPPRTYGPDLEQWALRTSQEPAALRARAEAAHSFAVEAAAGAAVELAYDSAYRSRDHRTPDGALLAYVYLRAEDDGPRVLLNEHLLAHGFALAQRGDYQEAAAFIAAETRAREEGNGFWNVEGSTGQRRRPPR
ncbi:MAG: hypothetical protein GVY15_04010 [Bacteroidetes bacterium]|jgi:micrococcal nuclease|nr:hypothetical protein [Bacteroidota bacterium]